MRVRVVGEGNPNSVINTIAKGAPPYTITTAIIATKTLLSYTQLALLPIGVC